MQLIAIARHGQLSRTPRLYADDRTVEPHTAPTYVYLRAPARPRAPPRAREISRDLARECGLGAAAPAPAAGRHVPAPEGRNGGKPGAPAVAPAQLEPAVPAVPG
jgi:hypothetical protein